MWAVKFLKRNGYKVYHHKYDIPLTLAIDEILFANIDVTSSTIAWIFLWIGSNMSIQESLSEEINSQLKMAEHDDDDISKDNIFNSYIGSTDTLLHKCYLETLRLSPPAFYSLPEKIPRDMVIQGWKIPKGQPFVIDAWHLNHSSPSWNDDGDIFSPLRFAKFEKMTPLKCTFPMLNSDSFWKFGIGIRKCLGQYISDRLIKYVSN